jgi:RNA polymerase primary sigma factor
MADYLSKIAKTRLLTPEQEISLSRIVQAGLKDDATEEEKKNTQRAVDKFITANTRLVVTIANKYAKQCQHLTADDLLQEGIIGLKDAVLKFDPTRGYKFSTYAYWWIRQTMTRAINNKERTVRLPCHIGERMTALKGKKDLTDSEKSLLTAASRTMNIISLNSLRNANQDSTELIEVVSNEDEGEPYIESLGLDLEDLNNIMHSCLTQNEILFLKQRYGFYTGTAKTNSDVGKFYGVSRERARQIILRAEKKLRLGLTIKGIHP